MGPHLTPAIVAVLAGVPVAVALFVPFVAGEYRRRGRLSVGRLLLWISSPVYAMALWTYTLLPLPDPATVVCAPAQLRPGQFIADILTFDVSSVGAILRNPAVQQVVLNVVLFVPLGIYLRWLWGHGVVAATAAALTVSALIEVTQLTGLFGLYPCAYRVFDVDDLLANTLGGLIGALIALLSARRRPTEALPTRVTAGRRFVGMLCDLLTVTVLSVLVGMSTRLVQIAALDIPSSDRSAEQLATALASLVPFILCGLVAAVTGRTIGDHAVGIRFAGRKAGVRRYVFGIGGFQLLGMVSGLDTLFAVISVVAMVATADRRGLPGLLLRRAPEIHAPAAAPHP
ncbi:VanZ family protein [Microbacterium stercoris]|uniref:VanZ family protein n=1 Tax=Microbacterium stercoris TaxID=2820289 RepID=A0A939QLX3_9MICO|nr:VanZ family protein [Microbacterium stercoris]MBO3661896.1 VanZ family protein [Microbacterium stercoris]